MEGKKVGVFHAGPPGCRSKNHPNFAANDPFVIEAHTTEGHGYLAIDPPAAAVLAEELAEYVRKHARS